MNLERVARATALATTLAGAGIAQVGCAYQTPEQTQQSEERLLTFGLLGLFDNRYDTGGRATIDHASRLGVAEAGRSKINVYNDLTLPTTIILRDRNGNLVEVPYSQLDAFEKANGSIPPSY